MPELSLSSCIIPSEVTSHTSSGHFIIEALHLFIPHSITALPSILPVLIHAHKQIGVGGGVWRSQHRLTIILSRSLGGRVSQGLSLPIVQAWRPQTGGRDSSFCSQTMGPLEGAKDWQSKTKGSGADGGGRVGHFT